MTTCPPAVQAMLAVALDRVVGTTSPFRWLPARTGFSPGRARSAR